MLIESESTKNKSNSQQKTLIQTILPCIALYKTLLQEGFSKEETTTYLQKYMFDGEKKILNAGAMGVPRNRTISCDEIERM